MKPIDILMVAPELKGYAQAGGIGDVIRELPIQLKRINRKQRIAVAMPWYGIMQETHPELKERAELLASVTYAYLGNEETSHIFHVKVTGSRNQVDLLLVQNMKYFELFGNGQVFVPSRMPFEQDAVRFGCFCRAIQAFLLLPDVTVRVLHLHDWMTAPLAVGIRHGNGSEELEDVAVVSTIHNASYQGDLYIAPDRALEILLGPASSEARQVVLDQSRDTAGGVNFMQALVRNSNLVSTVSESYRGELLAYGNRENFFDGAGPLAPVFHELDQHGAFWGIPNGLNYKNNNRLLSQNERRRKISGFVGDVSYQVNLPVFSVIGRLVEQKFGLLLAEDEKGITILEHILQRDALVMVLADGDPSSYYGWRLKDLDRRYPNLFLRIAFDPELAELIFRCSDLFLMLSAGTEPYGIAHLQAQYLGGVVPICHLIGGLRDNTSDACSYRFERGKGRLETVMKAKACIDRAMSEFPGPEFMRRREASGEKRCNWEGPARAYLSAYERARENNRLAAKRRERTEDE